MVELEDDWGGEEGEGFVSKRDQNKLAVCYIGPPGTLRIDY